MSTFVCFTPLAEVPATSQASIDNVFRRVDAAEASTPLKSALSSRQSTPKCAATASWKLQAPAAPGEPTLDTPVRIRRNDPYAFQCIGDLNAAATLSFQAAFGQAFAPFGYGYGCPFGYATTVLRQNESFDDVNASLSGESVGYVAPSSADVTPTKRRSPPAAVSLSPVPAFCELPCPPPPPPAPVAAHGRKHRDRHGSRRGGAFSLTDLAIALPSPLSAHSSACPSPLMDASTSVPATPTSTTSTTGKLSRGYCNGRPIPIRTQ